MMLVVTLTAVAALGSLGFDVLATVWHWQDRKRMTADEARLTADEELMGWREPSGK